MNMHFFLTSHCCKGYQVSHEQAAVKINTDIQLLLVFAILGQATRLLSPACIVLHVAHDQHLSTSLSALQQAATSITVESVSNDHAFLIMQGAVKH